MPAHDFCTAGHSSGVTVAELVGAPVSELVLLPSVELLWLVLCYFSCMRCEGWNREVGTATIPLQFSGTLCTGHMGPACTDTDLRTRVAEQPNYLAAKL